jgi:hypothetical protein
MKQKDKRAAFTLLEFIIAGGLVVIIGAFIGVGLHGVLDYKKNESMRPKLILEVSTALDTMGKDLDNKCTSLGNLLLREPTYPFCFLPADGPIPSYPSLFFFNHSNDGPQAICYALGPLPPVLNGDNLPTAPCGLYRLAKPMDTLNNATDNENTWQAFEDQDNISENFDEAEILKLPNLISDCTVFLEVRLAKFAANELDLEYFEGDGPAINVNAGTGRIGTALGATPISLKDLAFVEIAIGALAQSQHGEYFSTVGAAGRKAFLEKYGVCLKRLFPWMP